MHSDLSWYHLNDEIDNNKLNQRSQLPKTELAVYIGNKTKLTKNKQKKTSH